MFIYAWLTLKKYIYTYKRTAHMKLDKYLNDGTKTNEEVFWNDEDRACAF